MRFCEIVDDLIKTTKDNMGGINMGADPVAAVKIIASAVKVGALLIAKGFVKFAQWSRVLLLKLKAAGINIADFMQHLKPIYFQVADKVSDEDFDKMDSQRDVRKFDLDDIEIDSDRSVIDSMDVEVLDGMRNLSYAGISDVLSALNNPACLSLGQQYRYKLARALSAGKKIIFADEFCSNLDRVTACVIAYQIRKFARRTGTTFILASSHDDVIADLAPDVIVIKRLVGETEIVYRKASRQQQHERQANGK